MSALPQEAIHPEAESVHELAQQLRADAVRCSTAAGSGHPTSSLSAADLMAALFAWHLRYAWDDPEYVILEAGVDDDMCQVGLTLGSYTKKTAADVAATEAADAGVTSVTDAAESVIEAVPEALPAVQEPASGPGPGA